MPCCSREDKGKTIERFRKHCFHWQARSVEINDSTIWDAGVKYVYREYGTTNNFEVYEFPSGSFIKDGTRSNQFRYDRGIYAVYSNINIRVRSWQLRAGVRYEQTALQTTFKTRH